MNRHAAGVCPAGSYTRCTGGLPVTDMTIGVLEIEMRIPGVSSLKGKRMVVKSLKDRIRNKFNVSVSEVSHHSSWQSCLLGIAHVSTARSFTNRVLSEVLNFIQSCREIELVDFEMSLL
ncbi:MAG: DUF503 domain-containing protein [bacterium]|nr:DUF503 domain-containing protein [bacterium]